MKFIRYKHEIFLGRKEICHCRMERDKNEKKKLKNQKHKLRVIVTILLIQIFMLRNKQSYQFI